MGALTILAEIEPDDPELTSTGKAACIDRAKEYLRLHGGQSFEFQNVGNHMSDPTPHAFEYIWRPDKIIGYESAAGSGYAGVWCRGFARQRVITMLAIDGKVVAGSHAGSLNPSSPDAVSY